MMKYVFKKFSKIIWIANCFFLSTESSAVKFNDIKHQIFTTNMRQELLNWKFDALRQQNNNDIYFVIMKEHLENSNRAENKYILSKDTVEQQCAAFIEVIEYKKGPQFSETLKEKLSNRLPTDKLKIYFLNDKLVMQIGERIYHKLY